MISFWISPLKGAKFKKRQAVPAIFRFRAAVQTKLYLKAVDNMSVDTERRSGGQFVAWPN